MFYLENCLELLRWTNSPIKSQIQVPKVKSRIFDTDRTQENYDLSIHFNDQSSLWNTDNDIWSSSGSSGGDDCFSPSRIRRLLEIHQKSYEIKIGFTLGWYLAGETQQLLEDTYLKHITTSEQPIEGVYIRKKVQEVRFAVGRKGLGAICLVGEDWSSDWVGRIPKCVWYGAIMDSMVVFHFNVSKLSKHPRWN